MENFGKRFLLIIIILAALSCLVKCSKKDSQYKEITNEQMLEYEEKFRNEEDPDEKTYLEACVRPERFDTNKDRRISREEVRKALEYVLYPKTPTRLLKITPEVDKMVRNNIDLFVRTMTQDQLNYKQFALMMCHIHPARFINMDVVESLTQAGKEKVEPAGEL
jgi:hypothetical protein